MEDGSTVPCRRPTVMTDAGTRRGSRRAAPETPASNRAGRGGGNPAPRRPRRDGDRSPRGDRDGGGPGAPRKAAREVGGRPYRRPTQVGGCLPHRGERVIPPQGTRQTAPVTSGEGGPPGVTGPRGRERLGGAESGPRRLFTKNTGPCEAARRGIGADACPVPEG